jgi:hypothetical protein
VPAQYQDAVLKGMELRLHTCNSLLSKLVLIILRAFKFQLFSAKKSHQSGRKRVIMEAELDEVETLDKLFVYGISFNMSSRIHGRWSCTIFLLYT